MLFPLSHVQSLASLQVICCEEVEKIRVHLGYSGAHKITIGSPLKSVHYKSMYSDPKPNVHKSFLTLMSRYNSRHNCDNHVVRTDVLLVHKFYRKNHSL